MLTDAMRGFCWINNVVYDLFYAQKFIIYYSNFIENPFPKRLLLIRFHEICGLEAVESVAEEYCFKIFSSFDRIG